MSPNIKNRTLFTGDNLDIMRGMNSESVDLIYLDPPFNSNKHYSAPIGSEAAGAAFKDTWTLADVDLAWHGLIADEEPALYAIIDAAGHSHSKSMKSYLIMMAIRLLEMRRILNETGSIYLHCDPTASHYLKMAMDSVFGSSNFRSEIVWRRSNAHNKLAKQFGPIHDTLLFYTKGSRFTFQPRRRPYTAAYVKKSFPRSDDHGVYQSNVLTGSGTRTGESGDRWRNYDPTPHGRHWAIPEKIRKHVNPDSKPLSLHDILEKMDAMGLILHPKKSGGMPRYKQYFSSSEGILNQDIWAFQPGTQGVLWDSAEGIDEDVKWLDSEPERVGYPTQKPLGLLKRIVLSSSNEGDLILDPFCGCATALVAAEDLNRRWIGIDLSPRAADLVKLRLKKGGELFYQIRHRSDIPQRTDQGDLIPYRNHKHALYGKQEGQCAGCMTHFPFRNLTLDHVIPRAKGGTDHVSNLQLLCNACNSSKGQGSQEELVAKLIYQGVRQ